MTQVQLKFGRETVWVDENDIIEDTNSTVKIITKIKEAGWDSSPVRISRQAFKELNTAHLISTSEKSNQYKFNIDEFKKFGYTVREVS